MNIELHKCPHCGSDHGLYQKYYVSGWVQDGFNYKNSNIELYEGESYETLSPSREGKWLKCLDCHKNVVKVSDCT